MTWPFAVTSADDLGQLFRELDRLRKRLAGEVELYQSALDRTRDADTAKANFLAAVSHELRTPLNSIEGYSQLLLEGVPSPMTDPQREDVRLIRAGARQLLGLINDILDISMIESGDLRLTFAEHDPAKLIREVVDIHRPLVRQDDKVIAADCPDNLPLVVCDSRRIGQVLNNLVSNAIKFTEVGSITVRANYNEGDDHMLIRVIDTGMGISKDELDLVFEEFRQVGELKRRIKGTGLGLAIARSIAHHHGGSLTATSEPGVGSTFTLKLPLLPPKTPDRIDVTEERVRAQERLKKRTEKIPRYTTPAESMDFMVDADSDAIIVSPPPDDSGVLQ
jgi:signal transduction histidine kinase